jgi:hypothetical protein
LPISELSKSIDHLFYLLRREMMFDSRDAFDEVFLCYKSFSMEVKEFKTKIGLGVLFFESLEDVRLDLSRE